MNLQIAAKVVGLIWKEFRGSQLPEMNLNSTINEENCGVDFSQILIVDSPRGKMLEFRDSDILLQTVFNS